MLIGWLLRLRRLLELSATHSRGERTIRRARPHRLVLERLEDRTVPTFVALTGSKISMPVTSPAFQPFSVAVGDFTGNGVQDLAFGNGTTPGLIDIQQGLGNGTFENAGTVSLGSSIGFVRYIAAADLTNDGGAGLPDLITADFDGNDVSILQNTTTSPGATPTFSLVDTIPVGSQPFGVTTADLSGDGLQDIITANNVGNSITIIPNTSTGPGNISFGTPITIDLPSGSSSPRSVEPIEINGKLDLVTANFNSANLSLFQNTSTGPGDISFNPTPTTISLPSGVSPSGLAIADFNNDGLPDIAVGNDGSTNDNNIYVLLNQGNGTFSTPTAITIPGVTKAQYPIAADFTGDGNTDLAVVGEQTNNVAVLYGNGTGAFPTVETYATGSEPWMVASGDFNGDGAPDLVATDIGDDLATVYLNQAAASSLQVTPSATSPDVNTPFTVTVAAQYQGYTYQNYNGTVTLTDSNGLTLGTHTFVPADQGSYTFTVSLPSVEADTLYASDGTLTGTAQLNSVDPAITLSTGPLPADTVNVLYPTQTISASGGTGPLTLTTTVQNAVDGLIVPSSGAGSLNITGQPTASGTETFSVTATDTYGGTTTASYSITVNPAPSLSALPTIADTTGVAYSQTITARGGTGPVTLSIGSVVGSIPGLNLPGPGSSLAIAFTPTGAGTITFQVTATDSLGSQTTSDYSITVRNPVPTLSNVGITSAVDEGGPATLTGTINAPANQPLTLDVNWGDGTATQIYDLPAGTTTFSESYTYAATGNYAVSATIGDTDYSNDLLYGSTGGTTPNPGQLAVFDLANQTTTVVGNLPGENVTEIANNPALGQAWLEYGANDFEGEQFNIDTGAAIGSIIANATHENFNALIYINGTLYATGTAATGGTSPSSLYTLNPATGQATLIGATGVNGPISGIAYDAANSTLYGIEGGTGTTSLVSINLTTGAATTLFTTGFMAGSLSYAPDGNLYAGSSTGEIYLVNPTAKTVTPFLATGYTGAISGLTLGNDTANVQTTVNPAITLSSTTQTLIVTSYVTNAVYEFDANTGALLATLVAPNSQSILMGPAGVTIGPDGNLYITGEGYDGSSFTGPYNICEYNFSTQTLSTFITGAQMEAANGGVPFAPGGIAFGPDGNLYTDNTLPGAGADQVIRFGITNKDGQLSYSGTSTTIATGLSVACDITFGANPGDQGNLYVSDDNSVLKITGATTNAPTSSSFVSPGSGGLTYSCGLTWMGGNLYDTDPGSGQVLEYSDTGSFLGAFTSSALQNPNQQPINTLFLPDGDVVTSTFGPGSGFLVSTQGNEAGSLTLFNSSGQFLQNLGAGAFPANAAGATNVALAFMTLDTTAISGSSVALAQDTIGVGYNQTITPEGGTGAVTLTDNVTNAVAGLSITGSGTGSLSIIGTPTATGTETFTVRATDAAGGTTTTTYSITINPAPTLAPTTLPAGTINVAYNQTITATGGTGNVVLTLGTISNPIAGLSVAGTGTGIISVSDTPMASGTETFTVTATDGVGATDSITYAITVPPTVSISGPASVDEQATYTLDLSGIDGAPNTISNWTINWGDGDVQPVAGNPSSVTHVYAEGPNDYTISATATDNVGTYAASDTVPVAVEHVPPVLSISGAGVVNNGSVYTLDLSGSEPVAPHTISQWTINWGDGSAPQIVDGNALSVTHVFAIAAKVTISASASDDVGTYPAADTVAVVVTNWSEPTLAISGAAAVNEGAVYTLALSGKAAGGQPILQWTINWGDGAVQTVTGNPTKVTHVYAIGPNSYSISAAATDAGGTYAVAKTVSVAVKHVAPVVTFSGAASVNERAVYTLTLAGKDTHAITEWTINWGDGSPLQIALGNPTSVTHIYAVGPHTYTISASATDDVGTYRAVNTLAVAVKHVPPVLSIYGPAEIAQGSTYTLDLSATVTADHSIAKWIINWGDGDVQTVTGDPASVTHIYLAGPSTHVIHASAVDNVGAYSAGNTVTVTVDHVAPTLTISGAASVNEKAPYTLDLASSAPGTITIDKWTILWGDGTVQTVLGNPKEVTHVYAVGPNSYTIMATATDPEGTYAAADTVSVTVNHVPPTLAISGAATVNEGAIYTLKLSGVDTHPIGQWTIFWGDGTVQMVTGNPKQVTHVYASGPNSYTISASADDGLGTFNAPTNVTVNVKHVLPVVTFSGATSVNEGAVYTLTLSGKDSHAITQWTINWGDGTPLQIATGNPTSVTHVYADGPHTYTISASATDNVGTYQATNTLTVAVKHVPPTLTISGAAMIAQGSTYILNLSAVVTGTHAISKWIINWGDGSPAQTVTGNPSNVTHVYLAGPATHIIHASAEDDVGAYNAANTVTVTVAHVAPTLTISGVASVNEKALYTLDLFSNSPGTLSIKKWTILWGDGTVQTVIGNPTQVTHVYAVGPNSYTIMATATDPEGTYAALNTVNVNVNHVPPTLTISGRASVAAGSVYTLDLSGVDTHPISQWTIYWGDGTIQTVTGNPRKVTHVYAIGGGATYVISAVAADYISTYGAGDTVTVTVNG